MKQYTERAKRLVIALHEPMSNELRWEIADAFLTEEREEAEDRWSKRTDSPSFVPLSEKIHQTRAQNLLDITTRDQGPYTRER